MAEGLGPPTVVLDLDGVVWLAGHELPGASDAVSALRRSGLRLLFVTNNSSPTLEEMQSRLGRIGISAEPEEIITAAAAAASTLVPGTTAMVIGEAGVHEAVASRGVEQSDRLPDAVLVGWERSFDFATIETAALAIRQGAAFVATNDDPTHPTPKGLLPGTGALVAAIATAAEAVPLVAGKPGQPTIDLIRARASEIVAVVGDRPSTDGALAVALGAPFGLVESQATPGGQHHERHRASSLADMVELLIA